MLDDIIEFERFIEFNRAHHRLHLTFKEMKMAVNNPHGHNQYTDKKKMENADPSKRTTSASTSGSRGGTSEQHAEAGRQSHKNDEKSSSQPGRQGQKSDG